MKEISVIAITDYFSLDGLKYYITPQKEKLDQFDLILLNIELRISPIAKQHIYFQGHLTFSNQYIIDLDSIIEKIILGI